jgi:hypothetical protein
MAFADQFSQIADSYFGKVSAHPSAVSAWTGVISFAFEEKWQCIERLAQVTSS